MRLTLALLACLVTVGATSQGVATSTCDPWANIGCLTWGVDSMGLENRLNCTDLSKGPMPWATKPDRTAAYTVRTADGPLGQDPDYYVPGQMVAIYVRAVNYDAVYRGLLLTAYDEINKEEVGSWTFPADDEALFWSPPQCPKSAMHLSAAIKPYRVIIRFVAPPAGTGTILIRALIKSGPANDGAFHFPLRDLILREAYKDAAWYTANAGESCDSCCERNGVIAGADRQTQSSFFPAVHFQAAVEKKVVCNYPILSSCSVSAPVVDDKNYCYMKEDDCDVPWRKTTPVPNSRNLCACVVASPAPSRSISHWVMALVFGVSALSQQRRHLFIYLVLACVMLPAVRAHNWLHTPGRASTQASTIFPCQGRKATDLHAQVGPDQPFVTKWAVGHDRDSYFVLINAKDQDMLARSNFEIMVDDYLERGTKAPYNAPNLANDPQWMRYHGTYAPMTSNPQYLDPNTPTGALFAGAMGTGDANRLEHPRTSSNFTQLKYSDLSRSKDIRLSYESTEYPWIIMAFRAPHVYHLPNDFSSFRTSVPGRAGQGHFILHWRWSGYFDCIDIDVRSTAVANPYGVDGSGYVYNRIDHCQYISPVQVVTPCVEVGWDVETCLARLPGWMTDNRLGVNVVPFANPSTVYKGFKDIVNIPWGNGVCADSSWLRLQGTVTETSIDFNNGGVFKATRNVGFRCTNTMRPCNGGTGACSLGGGNYVPSNNMLNLKRAIALCVGHKGCKGLSIEHVTSGQLPVDSGLYRIELCTATTTAANSSWTSLFPGSLQTFPALNNAEKVYSFIPQRYSTTLAASAPLANNFRDFGAPWSATTKMGWTCKGSTDCSWCRYGGEPSGNDAKNYRTYNYLYGMCYGENVPRAWEVEVANGVYDVTVYAADGSNNPDVWVSGCNVEGVLMQDGTFEPTQPATITRRVEVTDGRLTLDGEAGADLGCASINWVSVKLVRAAWDESWLPVSNNPWWQMALDVAQPIGVVQIQSINYYYEEGGVRKLNCAAWWLFKGGKCIDGRPIGWFNDTAREGAKVGVSMTAGACGINGCTGTVCGWLHKGVDEWRIGQQYVDCKGAVGKYVWVYLPGQQRSLVFNVEVFAAKPNVPVPKQNATTVCYGVEARPQTATEPEFVISTDPEDPIFYSTCYSREKNITWLGETLTASTPVSRWRFHGHCLDCATYHHNAQSLTTTEIPAPWKVVNGECANCDFEGSPAPISKTLLPWKLAFQGGCADDRHNCSTNTCIKRLAMGGRSSVNGDDWSQQIMSEIDCQNLVEQDPECQPVAMYNRGWRDDGVNLSLNRRECSCWKKTACCGRCTPWFWDATKDAREVYTIENSVTPDPTCSTGIQSSDGTMCCKSYCKDAAGNSVCGWRNWQCLTAPVGGGACCVNVTKLACSEVGPPCLL